MGADDRLGHQQAVEIRLITRSKFHEPPFFVDGQRNLTHPARMKAWVIDSLRSLWLYKMTTAVLPKIVFGTGRVLDSHAP